MCVCVCARACASARVSCGRSVQLGHLHVLFVISASEIEP